MEVLLFIVFINVIYFVNILPWLNSAKHEKAVKAIKDEQLMQLEHIKGSKGKWEISNSRFKIKIVTNKQFSLTAQFTYILPFSMIIRESDFYGAETNGSGRRSCFTGDEVFDKSVFAQTRDLDLFRLYIRQPVRTAILELASRKSRFWITEKEVFCSQKNGRLLNFKEEIETFISICTMLDAELFNHRVENELDEYIKIILTDAAEKVRHNCLNHVLVSYSFENERRELLKPLLSSMDSFIRLETACLFGAETAVKYILETLKSPHFLDVKRAADAAGKMKLKKCISPLAEVYARQVDVDTKKSIIKAFKDIGDTSVSRFLVEILLHDDEGFIEDVLLALRVCGTRDAIEYLHEFSRHSFSATLEIVGLINETIAVIQNREGAGEAGWMSLAGSDSGTGNLAISEDSEQEE